MNTDLFKKEPLVILGVLFSLVAAIGQALSNAPADSTWKALAPLVVLAIGRFFVNSPATLERKEAEAKSDGKQLAIEDLNARRRELYAAKKSEPSAEPATKSKKKK